MTQEEGCGETHSCEREAQHSSALALARMQARLDSQPTIEQAKGILMAQSRCTPDEAFDVLRRASQRTNVPVRDIAAEIVAKVSGKGPDDVAGQVGGSGDGAVTG